MKLENVTVGFDGKTVIDDLSLEIPPGIHAVMAPSGRGKTTLLRAMASLIPYQGSITGTGRVAILFQEDRLFPWLTVRGNATLALDGEEEAVRWLKELGLADYLDAYPPRLSGGMRRRVSLAALFAYGGDTMLMDEPTRGLDANLAGRVMNLARQQANGKTLIFTTHSLALATEYADDIITI